MKQKLAIKTNYDNANRKRFFQLLICGRVKSCFQLYCMSSSIQNETCSDIGFNINKIVKNVNSLLPNVNTKPTV